MPEGNVPMTTRTTILGLAALLCCVACSKPEAPDSERPPEPTAAQATEVRDAIRQPIDRAAAVEGQVQDAAAQQAAAIDAQTGG